MSSLPIAKQGSIWIRAKRIEPFSSSPPPRLLSQLFLSFTLCQDHPPGYRRCWNLLHGQYGSGSFEQSNFSPLNLHPYPVCNSFSNSVAWECSCSHQFNQRTKSSNKIIMDSWNSVLYELKLSFCVSVRQCVLYTTFVLWTNAYSHIT